MVQRVDQSLNVQCVYYLLLTGFERPISQLSFFRWIELDKEKRVLRTAHQHTDRHTSASTCAKMRTEMSTLRGKNIAQPALGRVVAKNRKSKGYFE